MNLKERLRQWWLRFRCPSEFLCDNCFLDHDSACHRPQRPNAVRILPDKRPQRPFGLREGLHHAVGVD